MARGPVRHPCAWDDNTARLRISSRNIGASHFLILYFNRSDGVGLAWHVASAFAGSTLSAWVFILSDAKNPSGFTTKDKEGFFAQNQRSE